jgi:hypothetical protein
MQKPTIKAHSGQIVTTFFDLVLCEKNKQKPAIKTYPGQIVTTVFCFDFCEQTCEKLEIKVIAGQRVTSFPCAHHHSDSAASCDKSCSTRHCLTAATSGHVPVV